MRKANFTFFLFFLKFLLPKVVEGCFSQITCASECCEISRSLLD